MSIKSSETDSSSMNQDTEGSKSSRSQSDPTTSEAKHALGDELKSMDEVPPDFLDDLPEEGKAYTPKSYSPPTPAKQKQYFDDVWSMVVRFSQLPNISPEERFRINQVRGKLALLGGSKEYLSPHTFQFEMGRYIVSVVEPHRDLPDAPE